jgi:hypothetical protein
MISFKFMSLPIVPADIDEVEKRLGFVFPQEFRDHYLAYNGGRPSKDRLVHDGGTCVVDAFLPIKYGRPELSTLEQSFRRIKSTRLPLPEYLVQFAIDPGGDYYCFSIRPNEPGAIYLVHMDHHDEFQHPTEFLSSSLTEFLGRLRASGG